MKATAVAIAVLLVGLGDQAFAKTVAKSKQYGLSTPSPEGVASCTVVVSGKKRAGTTADLTIELDAAADEAQIAALGIGSGTLPPCDIFPDSPSQTVINVPTANTSFSYQWTLDVHSHPGNNCNVGDFASGVVTATLEGPNIRRRRFKLRGNCF